MEFDKVLANPLTHEFLHTHVLPLINGDSTEETLATLWGMNRPLRANRNPKGSRAMTDPVEVAPEVATQIEAIDALHGQVIAVTKTATPIAIEAGKQLIALKKSVPHGQFGPLMKANFAASEKS